MQTKSEIKQSKILITGGHSTPAFAVLDELLKRGFQNENFLWVSEEHNQRGNKNVSGEYLTVVDKYKIKFTNIKAGKLVRKWTRKTFFGGVLELFNLFIGFIQGFFIILQNRPTVVLSFGGFLAVPIVFWGRLFGSKVVTHEQTITTGMANKIIAKFANKILISFEQSKKYYPINKIVFTGNPIRKDVFEVKSTIIKSLDSSLPTIYITGGNQGANQINKRVFEILPKLLEKSNVIHQTGNSTVTNDFKKAMMLKNDLNANLSDRYIVKDYISADEIGEVFDKSDVIFSRAGANTILEELALGKLSVLMPIPWTSHDEQTKNAQMVVETGLGLLIKQREDLSPEEIYEALNKALECSETNKGFNSEDLESCKMKAKELVKLDAAEKVSDVVEGLII